MRLALLQMASCADKRRNLQKAVQMIREAANNEADIAVLPELFNFLPRRMTKEECIPNAENEEGQTISLIRELSKEEEIAIVAGSIIESEGPKMYNTAFVVTKKGILGKYRKNHLFNYGKIKESDVFLAGKDPLVADICGIKTGITICYDLRFPEIFRAEALSGAEAIINVAAFLEETGRAHWTTLLRARAIENLTYVIAANQAGAPENGFKFYGHSCIIDPWGRIVSMADRGEGIILGELKTEKVKELREKMPVFKDYKEY
ncbi:MAG: carbon-nitrogen hydrolase family protein [Candidatus Verstraetearchaeota archaeon]|nr:carbon-nitrogen hydrolase family protein [Candidatus Verstraetearchaeota archaeon]